jgi:apolipoprotein N-acyltransferase
MALALPQAVPWISLSEIDPAGHLEVLAWFALVPALFALDGARTWKGAFWVGLLSGLAYFYAAIWWVNHAMTAFGGVPLPIALLGLSLLVLYMAAHWAAAFLVSWTIRRRMGWPLWTHLPAVWTAAELSRNYLFTGFPWANLGYLQARHLAVAQLASLTGIYGIAALIVLVNCALHAVLRARLARRPVPARVTVAAAASLAIALGYGEAHLSSVRARVAGAPKLTVGIVQGNVDQATKNEGRSYGDVILGRYVPLTLEADRRGADLIAWPEASYPYLVPATLSSFADRRIGLPPLTHAHFLLGAAAYFERRGPGGRREMEGANSVFLLRPDLSVVARYAKHHLVPFGEYVPLQGLLGGFLRSVVPEMVTQRPGAELRVLEFTPSAATAAPAEPSRSAGPAPGRDEPGREPSSSSAGQTGSSGASPGPASIASASASIAPAGQPPRPRHSPPGSDERSRPPVRVAPMICYDAIFPEVNIAYAAQEPNLLLNPTNDAWYGYSSGPYQFLAMVRMRAIEAGKAVARPAYAGVSALISPTGEVLPGALPVGPVDPDLAPDPNEPPRLLLGEVPLLRGRTLYTRFGDLFAGAASAFSAVALALALRRRPPRSGAAQPEGALE